ncbi:DUF6916 family protein [Methylomicrobium album]|uniref:DUF6916 domain-containing protein n=1 Tax=Methylomicrobium album BG8 TaxID=686340 RepID=H8GR65_METAL|nr:hypothetical protein [Methylomicrobium album]EIC29892.1 hypothetical protein Metal_2138 [Methylomicrobium album BG8]
MLEALTKENWEACLNEDFQVQIDDRNAVDMKLVSVSGFGRSLNGRREAYSLLFQGPGQPVLVQRIYRVQQPQLGSMDIFLVPVGKDAGGIQYEAVFT